jgi:predicted DNA-binding transcriptional regulator AlpA
VEQYEVEARESEQLLDALQVCQLLRIASKHRLRDPLGAAKKQLQRLRSKSNFPMPVKLGKERRWFASEIMVWARQHRRQQLRRAVTDA